MTGQYRQDLQAVAVDLHAHFVPGRAAEIPTGSGITKLRMDERTVTIGDLCIPLTSSLSHVEQVLADMDRSGVAVRVLSGPPFTFATDASGADAASYAREFNEALSVVCSASEGRLLGLGLIPLADPEAAEMEMDRIRERPGLFGIAVPPVLGEQSFESGPLRDHALAASVRGLGVLVHPTQPLTAELSHHYLSNLIGNPTQTAVAVASLLLGGVMEEAPQLRICFLHGGGSTSALLGRWDHGWRAREDVRVDSSIPPSEAVGQLYFDTLTHDPAAARDLRRRFSEDRLVLGSDYPFDMGDARPVDSARGAGLDVERLADNAYRFLGIRP